MADSQPGDAEDLGHPAFPDDPFVEASAIAGSAAALLRELVEEEVTDFDRLPVAAPGASALAADPSASPPRPAPSPRPSSEGTHTAAPPKAPARKPNERAFPTSPVDVADAVPWGESRPSLSDVAAHLGDCTRCGLCEGRSKIVFGDGHPEADLMFIGEGPGEHEDRQGLPFVGRAGELLTQMIEKGIGLSRNEVYICNIVKCRPPRNRTPLPPEVAACRPFLDGQIRAVAPKVIVTLGKPAASLLLGREVAITRERGTWQTYQGIPLMPTLHPAYILRQYTQENRRAVWQDLKAAFERIQP